MYKYHTNGSLPESGEYFVFGSNNAGIHGAGAARKALDYGAEMGKASGFVGGQTYAIPTKDSKLITLSLDAIRLYVYRFKSITHMHHGIKFFVTGVGTGLAGYDHKDIAPMFKGCNTNCSFPQEWEQYLKE